MVKFVIEVEDAFKDGKAGVSTKFRMEGAQEGPVTDAACFAYVCRELWQHGAWKGLAKAMLPDVFNARALAAQQAKADAAVAAEAKQAAVLDAAGGGDKPG